MTGTLDAAVSINSSNADTVLLTTNGDSSSHSPALPSSSLPPASVAAADELPIVSTLPLDPGDAAAEATKKRRSRWGQPGEGDGDADGAAAARKRSRWGDKQQSSAGSSSSPPASAAAAAALTAASIAAAMTASMLSPAQLEHMKLQGRIDELSRLMLDPVSSLPPDAPRSPSPEPVYDSHGQRTNTREQRLRARYTAERSALIEQLSASLPSYRPPSDYRRQTRFEHRLYIPVKQFPDYNFIGLIIGPRGSTQKQMERDTGCKIVIRGRGSSKEGKVKTRQQDESDNDDIHVLITGDSQQQVDAATAIVEKLLIPVDEAVNEHKSRQLRELAIINGTLRDDVICRVCGQRGHRIHDCPERLGAAWKPADVRCEWCGESSHLTADCPTRRDGQQTASRVDDLNAEYASFMSEITGGSGSLQQQRGIAGLLEHKDDGAGKTAASGETAAERDGRLIAAGGSSAGDGRRPGQLMLTDGTVGRGGVLRVGDGIVRRIVSNDPREHAREFRPNQPPSHHHGDGLHSAPHPHPPPPPPPSPFHPGYPPYGYYPPPAYPMPYPHPGYPPRAGYPPPPAHPYYYPPAAYPPPAAPPAAPQTPTAAETAVKAVNGGGAAGDAAAAESEVETAAAVTDAGRAVAAPPPAPAAAPPFRAGVNAYPSWPPPAHGSIAPAAASPSSSHTASGNSAASGSRGAAADGGSAGINRYASWPPPQH